MAHPSPPHRKPPLDSVAELGERVRAQRRRLRATQAEAADLAGVGVRFLSELERGKESVEFGKVLRVLRALGLDVFVASRGGDGLP
jgi:y4mF family transcriptional regulator